MTRSSPMTGFPLRTRLLPALLAALTAGCALTEPVVRPEQALPAQWSGTCPGGRRTATPLHDTWWQDFGSARLDAFVTEALAAAPDLRIQAERVVQAELALRQAGASLLPSLDVSAGSSTRAMSTAMNRARPASASAPATRSTSGAASPPASTPAAPARGHPLRLRRRPPVDQRQREPRLVPGPGAAGAPGHRAPEPRHRRARAARGAGALRQRCGLGARSEPAAHHGAQPAPGHRAARGATAPDAQRARHPAWAQPAGRTSPTARAASSASPP
jgi:hypothetical protein